VLPAGGVVRFVNDTLPLYSPADSEFAAAEKPIVTVSVAPVPLRLTVTGLVPPLMEIHG